MNEKVSFLPNHVYQIISKSSGKALTVANISSDNGAFIQVAVPADIQGQFWKFTPADDTSVRLINCQSQKALDIIAMGTENGAWLHQWDASPDAESQLWMLEICRDGSCKLKSKLSGKCIDIVGMSLEAGAQLQLWDDLGGDNQKWFCKDCTELQEELSGKQDEFQNANKKASEDTSEKKVKKERKTTSESKSTKTTRTSKKVADTAGAKPKKEKIKEAVETVTATVEKEAVEVAAPVVAPTEKKKQPPAISPATPPLKKLDQTTKAIKTTDPKPETSLVAQEASNAKKTTTRTNRKRPTTEKK